MRPSLRLLIATLGWMVIGVFASLWEQFMPLWTYGGFALFALCVVDALMVFSMRTPKVTRTLPSRFALGADGEVRLRIANRGSLAQAVDAFDGIPDGAQCGQLPWTGKVPRGSFADVLYDVRFHERGVFEFGACHLLIHSPFGLWRRGVRTGETREVKVYPNYEPVVRLSLLSTEHAAEPMGIRYQNRIGMSREFHQLHEYQDGDPLSIIDWKATSRHQRLISREFQEQRNQNVVLVVDAGRRMRAMDGDVSQFDHCLNAMLLLSYIALRQGDNVGVLSFGGTERWLPPVKGLHSMSTILNHLYDYKTTTGPSDFAEASERLMMQQQRRALVVVLTNLRSEDSANLVTPMRLMQRRHLVMVASLRERELALRTEKPVASFDEALGLASTYFYFEERRKVFEELRSRGIHTVDELADNLPVAITNEYLRIKRAGML